MDILGIGPLELFFIILIALIIFGPNDIVKAARTVGSFMRKVVTSDGYRAFQQASKGMKDLPTTLMREAGLEEEELRQMTGYNDFKTATRDFVNLANLEFQRPCPILRLFLHPRLVPQIHLPRVPLSRKTSTNKLCANSSARCGGLSPRPSALSFGS
jgi:Sec-independent protein translocase protein TatA